MFTGIIRELGTVQGVQQAKGLMRLSLFAPKTAAKVARLDSVAVHGVCLTVVDVRAGALLFEVVPETLRLTNLSRLRPDQRVHVEPSLTLADRLGGHLVLGHVDGLGTVVARRERGGELVLGIRFPRAFAPLIIPKGPIAVDGVSLTVGERVTTRFTLHLIPETRRQTTLAERRVGDTVNLEMDYLAKVARRPAARTARRG